MTQRLTGFSPVVRKQIQDRSEGICEVQAVCSWDPAQHRHHRRARGMGSTRRPETNQAANGLDACSACHAHLESHRMEALECGWLVPQVKIPQDVPVLRRGEWVMLFNTGDFIAIPEPSGGRVA